MCLIAFAVNARPGLPLLLAANRDEFFDRPTARLHRWALADGTQVLAGRDLRDGGTWLGVSLAGRVAMLTNVRSTDMPATRSSRGELATNWLSGRFSDVADFAKAIEPIAYGGFNLVVGDMKRDAWCFLSNRDPARPHDTHKPALWQQTLGPGVYCLSNASLDTGWPKALRLRSALSEALEAAHGPDDHWQPRLFDALGCRTEADPQTLPSTGVPLDLERALSSPFVYMPERGYGTLSSLIMRTRQVQSAWELTLDEWWHHRPEPACEAGPAWSAENRRRETVLWRL